MLRLPPFDLRLARSLAEAVALLAGEGAAADRPVRVVAGGTDLYPNLKRRHEKAETVVSLMRVAELRGIRDGDGELRIGATTTLTELLRDRRVGRRFPALAAAVASISTPVLRNMGTIGGNLCLDTRCTYYNQNEEWRRAIDYCLKEEGTVCWVAPGSPRCWAVSASDAAPMLDALEARVRLVGAAGERVVPVAALYRDDGIDYLAKRPEEILAEVLVPAASDAAHCRAAFAKLRRRGSIDFSTLSAAAAAWLAPDGTVERARIVLGSVASRPAAADAAAAFLVGRRLDDRDAVAAAAALARDAATPLDNTDFQAQWRGLMVERTVHSLLGQLAGGPAAAAGN
jgi:4-hydroxybenzoyl-CoA reductase subunit beta